MIKARLLIQTIYISILFLCSTTALAVQGIDGKTHIESQNVETTSIQRYRGFFTPISPVNNLTTEQLKRIALGQTLFEDVNLSHNNKMSCATCHITAKGYADGKSFSQENKGVNKEYNTPSIQYSIYNQYLTWLGAFSTLQEHLDFLITNSTLMNRDWDDLTNQLKTNREYKHLFEQAGYKRISRLSISNAIIAYEASLAIPSRFDFFLLGDVTQLTSQEIKGLDVFITSGCISCHQGTNLGGNLRQKFGVMKDYFPNKISKNRDLGYFNITKNIDDMHLFRVPSLRNVTKTGPYFHDASAKTLEKAIEIMFSYQLGIKASQEDILSIKSFLESLEPVQ
ncbi:MAG: cytochrome B6 [Psychrobium sp.]|nr:cytochrome B6 [Psychrobium sp.]